ncbi:MAG: NADH-quinone oxidoreductase subunit L [Candidatus Omnitrophica bacterium]|nr:NADH-quinone oxidoreductase subunit L [Candidatus Omnitrophota bacterium]
MNAQNLSAVTTTITVPTPELAWIPLLPLAAFIIILLFGRRAARLSAWLSVAALASSGMVVLAIAGGVFRGARLILSWPWLSLADPRWSLGLSVDGLSWLMLFIVTVIGTMIQLYSIGYMHEDPRFSRFFAYLSLFCASMLGLVLADHFVLLYACWELVGLCSYLLISFWFEKPAAAAAGRKAFLTTRVGDTGLFVGILLLAWTAGELRLSELGTIRTFLAPQLGLLTAISLLIFLGAVGKSAQVPLHVWLPDAMEGPTPVSALIHAATMVAAGVYLVARTLPLFTAESLQVVLAVGLVTHLAAGTVALTMTDIKRVLAYSTVSQLGLMMTALGLGAMSAAIFHLYTHAFFKALLFLGAGSVIHATRQQDLGQLGGLRRAMPWTAAVFFIGALAMGGAAPLSGFWSKDAILLAARQANPLLLWLLLSGAVMTTSYIFRLYFLCFEGQTHHAGGHPHESPRIMVGPLMVLAVGAAAAGFAGSPFLQNRFFHLLGDAHAHEGIDLPMLLWSSAALLAGVGLAWVVGVTRRNLLPEALRPLGHTLYVWASNKYYVDEAYDRAIIQPFLRLTGRLDRFDQTVVDGAVNGAAAAGWQVSQWKAWIDQHLVDRAVNGVAQTVRGLGAVLRGVQTGIVQQYLLVLVVSVVLLSVAIHR